jgi:PQQ-like domain
MRNRLAVGVVAGLIAAASLTSSAVHATATAITPNGSWPTYHHDDGHTGFDSSQPVATTATTGWTSLGLDGSVYVEPLVYQGIVYVATLNNTVYALNQTDGSQVWSTHLRAPQTTGWSCGNVSPQGILGTPVIDPATGRIYAATLGSDNVYRLEGLNLTTGLEELNTVITTPAPAFDWHIEQERGALAVRNGYVYVPFGGRAGDCGAYHGSVFAVPTNGTAVAHFYQTPGEGAGFWTAGGVVVDDSTGKVFETSGNGVASGCNSNPDGTPVFENDAVVRLSATLAHEDAFIPADWQGNWCNNDQDLGSASMVLISPTLAFQAGKWGNGFLVNPQALGGVGGQLYPTPKPAAYGPADVCFGNNSDANFGSYAYAAPYVYLSCDANSGIGFTGRLVALKVDTATPSFSACVTTCGSPSWAAGSSSFGPPIVAGGAVWVVSTGGGGLYGFDAATGAQIYHSAGFSATHFTTPSEAGGQIFVGSGNVVRTFKMVSGCRSVMVSASPPSPGGTGTSVTLTANASGCPNPNPLYQFWVLPPGGSAYQLGQAYSTNATFNWNTSGLAPGDYRFSIWARDANSTGLSGNQFGRWDAYDNSLLYTLTTPSCSGLSASPAPMSPAGIGTTVTVTAQVSGCTDPNPLYQFWVLPPGGSAYLLQQAYSTSRTFSWNTAGLAPGDYHFSIWARDASSTGVYGNQFGRWDAYNNSIFYTLTAPACSGLSASAAPASAAGIGTTVAIHAQAGGCPDPNPLYQFWVLPPGGAAYQLGQAYSTNSTFSWSTSGLAPGSYRFSIWARDANSSGAYGNQFGRWDSYNNDILYTLTTCSGLQVSVSPASPAARGTTVTVTAQASGCPDPNPQYQFWILPPGGTAYQLSQAYSTSSTFTWNTTGLAPGSYRFSVWVRDANSAGAQSNQFGSWDSYNNSAVYSLT